MVYLISRVFLAWTFLNFLAHCGIISICCHKSIVSWNILCGILALHTYVEYFKVCCMQCSIYSFIILYYAQRISTREVCTSIFSMVGCLLFLSKCWISKQIMSQRRGAKVIWKCSTLTKREIFGTFSCRWILNTTAAVIILANYHDPMTWLFSTDWSENNYYHVTGKYCAIHLIFYYISRSFRILCSRIISFVSSIGRNSKRFCI